MTEYQVELDRRATEDIEDSVNWLAQRSPHKVEEWLDTLETTLNSLRRLPERCPLAPENGRWEEALELRQLLFDDYPSIYRIIFTVLDGATVRILQIRHGARRYLFESE